MACGVDVVELERFRRACRRGGEAFLRRIFTAKEEAYARARTATTVKHLAGRFAAKEAVIKALSQLDGDQVPTMRQVEICNDALGRPSVVLHDGRRRGVTVHVSLSHGQTLALASAIVTVSSGRR